MTWAEFKLRLISFDRSETREEYKLRRLAWISYTAPHQDPKKLRGLSEDRWWRIGKKKEVASEDHKKRFIEEYKKYLEKTKNGRA